LFGFNTFFYHFLIFSLFASSIYLFNLVLKKIGVSKKASIVSLIIFSFSHTIFTRLYFLSAAQEMMLNFFILLALLSSLKNSTFKQHLITSFWYVLALLSKDSAIVFPVLVLVFDWLKFKKINYKKIAILLVPTFLYLYIRIFLFGFDITVDGHESYQLNFSPVVMVNTMYTYVLWAVGGAELLKDYLSSPITLLKRFYTDFGLLGKIMIGLLITTLTSFGVLTVKNIKKNTVMKLGAIIVFIVSLAPVLLLPNHKFTIQMSMPMFGFALFIGLLLEKESKKVISLVLFLYLALNISSIMLTQKTHYSVQRSQISSRVYEYFKKEYPTLSNKNKVIFLNTDTSDNNVVSWGSSKQISHALMENYFFMVMYPGQNIEVLYEDLAKNIPIEDDDVIYLDSKMFLQN